MMVRKSSLMQKLSKFLFYLKSTYGIFLILYKTARDNITIVVFFKYRVDV